MPDTEWSYLSEPDMPAVSTGSRPTSPSGPPGRVRNPWVELIWIFFTWGLWLFYGTCRNFAEIKRHTGRGLGWISVLFIAVWPLVLVLPLWSAIAVTLPVWVLPALLDREIEQMYAQNEWTSPVTVWTGVAVLIPVAGLVYWWWQTQKALNEYWAQRAAAVA